MDDNGLKFLEIGAGTERRSIAVRDRAGAAPGLFWLSGYKSDMKGTKAVALAEWAEREQRSCVRFDYSGHGESDGAFTDGTIGRWLEVNGEAIYSTRPWTKYGEGPVADAAAVAMVAARAKGDFAGRTNGQNQGGGGVGRSLRLGTGLGVGHGSLASSNSAASSGGMTGSSSQFQRLNIASQMRVKTRLASMPPEA